jgi:hypothetical protein
LDEVAVLAGRFSTVFHFHGPAVSLARDRNQAETTRRNESSARRRRARQLRPWQQVLHGRESACLDRWLLTKIRDVFPQFPEEVPEPPPAMEPAKFGPGEKPFEDFEDWDQQRESVD